MSQATTITKEFLTRAQAAKVLKCTPQNVSTLRESGYFPGAFALHPGDEIKRPSGWLYPRAEIEAVRRKKQGKNVERVSKKRCNVQ